VFHQCKPLSDHCVKLFPLMSVVEALAAFDAAISRPLQKVVLPALLEQLLAFPGGRLFGKANLVEAYSAHRSCFTPQKVDPG
jgi:hypothetical protein